MKLLDILLENYEEKEIFPNAKVAYHVTPDIYIENIKKEGLTPKSESKVENHPERIYLYGNPESSYKKLVSDLWTSSKYKDRVKNYYVLEVDFNKIPEHRFYQDPQSFFGYLGIYTKQVIPPTALKVVEIIPTKDLPASSILDDMSDDDSETTPQYFNTDSTDNTDKWDEILKNISGDETIKLNENIHRIQSMMGVITEDATTKVTKMVDDIGLINTIKFLGGYNNFKELYGGELSKEDKIKFIQEVIYKKVPEITGRNNISIFDLKVPPIQHDSYGITERMITTFYRGGVKLNVYKYGKFSTDQMTTYDNISEDVINKIFKLMIDLLERKQEEITEGLHDTSWENDKGDKITLVDLLRATKDIPVKKVLISKIKSKLLTWDDDNENAKIDKADLRYPILIFVDDNNKFISIIDGHHRAQKAVKNKLKTIKAKIIPINSLPKNIRKVFSHMGNQK